MIHQITMNILVIPLTTVDNQSSIKRGEEDISEEIRRMKWRMNYSKDYRNVGEEEEAQKSGYSTWSESFSFWLETRLNIADGYDPLLEETIHDVRDWQTDNRSRFWTDAALLLPARHLAFKRIYMVLVINTICMMVVVFSFFFQG